MNCVVWTLRRVHIYVTCNWAKWLPDLALSDFLCSYIRLDFRALPIDSFSPCALLWLTIQKTSQPLCGFSHWIYREKLELCSAAIIKHTWHYWDYCFRLPQLSHLHTSNTKLKMKRIYNHKSRRLRWVEHVARMEEVRSALKMLTGKPKGKIPLGGSRRRWENNIRMDLEEIGINAGNWVVRLRIGIIGEPL